MLTDDEINMFSYYSILESPPAQPPSQIVGIHNYHSQAEQAFMNFSSQKGQSIHIIAQGFVHKFEMKCGLEYPKHPNLPHLISYFVIGHRVCNYCGGNHTFRACPGKDEPCTLQKMHFNIYCHQTKMYFTIDCSEFNRGDKAQKFNYQPIKQSQSSFKCPRFDDGNYYGSGGRDNSAPLPA